MTISSRSVANPDTHIPVLDSIRGFAAVSVALFHFQLAFKLAEPLNQILGFGWSGVDLFFTLSGFLITRILIGAVGESNYFKTFYIRRTLRIFPLYYAALFVAVILCLVLYGYVPAGIAWYFSYLQNFSIIFFREERLNWIGHFWTLAIEEQFYLVWPLIVYLCRGRHLLLVSSAGLLLSLVLRFLLVDGQALSPWEADRFTPTHLDSILAGVFIAALLLHLRSVEAVLMAKRAFGAALAAGLILIIALGGWRAPPEASYDAVPDIVGCLGRLLLFAGLIGLAVLTDRTRVAFLLWKPFQLCGRYSYCLYVIHVPVHIAFVRYAHLPDFLMRHLPGPFTAFAAYTLIVGGLCLAVCHLSWTFFEQPILSLRSRFEAGRKARPAVQPT
jgi:peptidoglycan/LPS O-acetylase OafA/YrhL